LAYSAYSAGDCVPTPAEAQHEVVEGAVGEESAQAVGAEVVARELA